MNHFELQILIQWVYGGAWDSEFLTSSQTMLLQLRGCCLDYTMGGTDAQPVAPSVSLSETQNLKKKKKISSLTLDLTAENLPFDKIPRRFSPRSRTVIPKAHETSEAPGESYKPPAGPHPPLSCIIWRWTPHVILMDSRFENLKEHFRRALS